MKDLKNVDIICANSVNPNEGVLAIQYCQNFFNFGRSILFTDIDGQAEGVEVINIDRMNSVGDYNDFILGIGKYLNNDHVLVVQDDGHIINPDLWDDEFLKYDYIGAPWPLEAKWIDGFRSEISERMWNVLPKNRVGNGGFSLRSKKYLEFSAQFSSCEGWGEDEFLCQIHYEKAIEFGIKFAPFELALKFSYENPLQEMGTPWGSYVSLDRSKHFGWHGTNFANTAELLNIKHLEFPIQPIDKDRWNDAQSMELWHMLRDTANEESHEHGTKVIFEDHFGLDYEKDFVGKTILESGGGRFPHVTFCGGVKNKISVEPLFDRLDEYSQKYQVDKGVQVVQCAFEDYEKPDDLEVDEVWFFNVLQHVKDPILQIEKAKGIANIIRVFEPINVPTDTAHPHMFDIEFFEKHFPESTVNKYIPDSKFAPFFGCECAYLVWEREV